MAGAARAPLRCRALQRGAFVLTVALRILHMWPPADRGCLAEHHRDACAVARQRLHLRPLLSDFSYAYVHCYAGLASEMTALVFLYLPPAWIFIFSGEFNAGIAREAELRQSIHSDRVTKPPPS
jgi:hypothetical protein